MARPQAAEAEIRKRAHARATNLKRSGGPGSSPPSAPPSSTLKEESFNRSSNGVESGVGRGGGAVGAGGRGLRARAVARARAKKRAFQAIVMYACTLVIAYPALAAVPPAVVCVLGSFVPVTSQLLVAPAALSLPRIQQIHAAVFKPLRSGPRGIGIHHAGAELEPAKGDSDVKR